MSLPETPNTKRERYYSVVAGQNDTDILPENPVSTEDRYLDYIARNGGGGGGGDIKIFTGTLAEWNLLSPAEQASYTHIFTTDPITTLAGYGITDAYTKAEVDALLNTETAEKLYEGLQRPTAAATVQLTKSLTEFRKIYMLWYRNDDDNYVDVSEVSVNAIITAYDWAVSRGDIVGVRLPNTADWSSESSPTSYKPRLTVPVTGTKATDMTQIMIGTHAVNSTVAIIGIK